MSSRTARVALNALSNYLRFAVSLAVFFVTTPVMIRELGKDGWGLLSLTYSVLGFFSLLEMGFGTATVKYVASAGDDSERVDRVVSTFSAIHVGMASVATVIVIVMTPFYARMMGIAEPMVADAIWLLWLLALRSAILYLPLNIFYGILFSWQRIGLTNAIQAVCQVLYGIGIYYGLKAGWGLQWIGWLSLATMLLEHAAYIYAVYRERRIRISIKLVDRGLIGEAASLSMFTFIISVSGLVLMRMDPIIIQVFVGSIAAVGVYSLASRISENLFVLVKQFINVFTPLVAQLKASGDEVGIRFVLINCCRFALLPASMIAIGVAALGERGLSLWVKNPDFSIAEAASVLTILCLVTVALVPQMLAATILMMTGHHRFMGYAALASAVINLVASVILVHLMGLTGVALGSLVAIVIVDVCVVVPYACRTLNVPLRSYITRVAPSLVVCSAANALVTFSLFHYVPRGFLTNTIPGLLVVAMPGAILHAAVFWRYFVEDSEKSLLFTKLLGRKAAAA